MRIPTPKNFRNALFVVDFHSLSGCCSKNRLWKLVNKCHEMSIFMFYYVSTREKYKACANIIILELEQVGDKQMSA